MSQKKLRILYIDAVGPFGGASKSLYEAVNAITANSIEAYFLVQRGTVIGMYGKLAKDIIAVPGLTKMDNTRYGYYRGLRWLILLRELFYFPITVFALLRARKRWGRFDLIHQNEILELLPGILAKYIFSAPLVIHVRSMQRVKPNSWRCLWIERLLKRYADAVVAIDENVRTTLSHDLPIHVIHNSFAAAAAVRTTSNVELSEKLAALRPESLKVGFVGSLHRSKGLFELLDAVQIATKGGFDIELIVVGGDTMPGRGIVAWALNLAGMAQSIGQEIREIIEGNQIEHSVHLFGHTYDIQMVYKHIDVIAFPSHFNAPGRPVFEAAFFEVPSIVALDNPKTDTLVHGQTGLAIPAKDPQRLAQALVYFANDRAEVQRMGVNAKRLAEENFSPEKNSADLYELYRQTISNFR